MFRLGVLKIKKVIDPRPDERADFVFRFGRNFDFFFITIGVEISPKRNFHGFSGQFIPLAVLVVVVDELPREVADAVGLADVIGGVAVVAVTFQ